MLVTYGKRSSVAFFAADVLVTSGKRSCVVFSTADVLVTSGKRSCVVFPTADVLVTSGKRSCVVLSTRDVLVTSDKLSCVIFSTCYELVTPGIAAETPASSVTSIKHQQRSIYNKGSWFTRRKTNLSQFSPSARAGHPVTVTRHVEAL